MIPGLSEQENEFIISNLITPLKDEGCKVYLFGSRSTNLFKKFSDIDLLYFNNTSTDSQLDRIIFHLMLKMENSKFPYKIDLVKSQDLATSFRSKVDSEKIEL